MPVCSRMEYFAKVATVDGMSAARTPSSAPVRFCTWLVMTPAALCRRLNGGPIVPPSAAPVLNAAVVGGSAAGESGMLESSVTDSAGPVQRGVLANEFHVT